MAGLRTWLRLFRVQTGGLTALAPVVGYMIAAPKDMYVPYGGVGIEVPRYIHMALLFIVGLLGHIYGNIQNEVCDYELDCRAGYLKDKPLVSGTVSLKVAKGAALAFLALSLGLGALASIPNPIAYGFLLLAALLVYLYDRYGKRFAGFDFVLAAGISALVLFGYHTGAVGGGSALSMVGVGGSAVSMIGVGGSANILLWSVCALAFLQVTFNNSVEGGIKDLENDSRSGARTTALALGCKVADEGSGRVVLSRSFIAFAVSLKGITIAVAFSAVIMLSAMYILALAVLLVCVIMGTMALFLTRPSMNREKLKQLFSVHEVSTYGLTCTVLLSYITPLTALCLFLVPFVLYLAVNLVVHGSALSPKV